MLLAGDELRNSQSGNNNAYCQNNPTGWVQWDGASSGHINLVSRLIDLRSTLDVFRHAQHVHASWTSAVENPSALIADCALSWRRFDGVAMASQDWHVFTKEDAPVDSAAPFALLWATVDELVVLALNPLPTDETLTLPESYEWRAVLDTACESGAPGQQVLSSNNAPTALVAAQSLSVFLATNGRNLATETSA